MTVVIIDIMCFLGFLFYHTLFPLLSDANVADLDLIAVCFHEE